MTQATQPTVSIEANLARIASIKLAGEAYSQSGMFSEDAKTQAIAALTGCDFPMYENLRDLWKGAYMADRNQGQTDSKFFVTEDAAKMAWSRMLKEFAIEVPKSATKEATEAAAKRAAEKAELAKLSPAVITAAKDDAQKLAATALAAGDLKTSEAKIREVKTFDAELSRRHAEANKPTLELMAKKREAIRKVLNTCTLEQLVACEKVLGINVTTVPPIATTPLVNLEGKPKGRAKRGEQATA